ncbi:HPr family phosphocarrier protein [Yinghuangia sp. YIM S09857]|uniref:HPr family phosphocarrier protein n=1 Tax=Yinghuangia sp. YIM S09857 TaxID=3436929 RepID=UPI003F531495
MSGSSEHTDGPAAGGWDAAGPGAAGADADGPEAIGADASGAGAAGPQAFGAEAAGPGAAGPEASGPEYAEDVVLGADLHMRPAGAVVRTAARYTAHVELVADGRVARASSVLEIMGLGARAGTPVTVRGRGTDAQAAVGGLAVQLRDTV